MIARRLLTDDPAIDDSDWRERIKCALLAQGWTYPKNRELIGEAMKRVERDIERPVPVPPLQARTAPSARPATWRPASYEPRVNGQFTSLADLIEAIKKRRRNT